MDNSTYTYNAKIRDKKLHIKLFLLDNINKFDNEIISIIGKDVMDDVKKRVREKSSLGEGDRQILIDILLGISNIEAKIKKIFHDIGEIKYALGQKGIEGANKKRSRKSKKKKESKGKSSIADAVNINEVLAQLKDEEIDNMITDPVFDEFEKECQEEGLDKDCQEYAIRRYVREVLER